ncbi:hypothetical protein RhiirA4_485945 [Rhizophagus irregularis]|uniref:Uncharacterized protein n=1 Tax=Rhizophagus irregularis TaxID=588596 RepID=A0A2I1HQR7_9GLOM|nr:hypothetical protein RhiirA4_485945 [Rhizophagus irregularis]
METPPTKILEKRIAIRKLSKKRFIINTLRKKVTEIRNYSNSILILVSKKARKPFSFKALKNRRFCTPLLFTSHDKISNFISIKVLLQIVSRDHLDHLEIQLRSLEGLKSRNEIIGRIINLAQQLCDNIKAIDLTDKYWWERLDFTLFVLPRTWSVHN